MTTAQDIRMFGVVLLVVTVIALWLNVTLLAQGQRSPVLTAVLGLLVGVGGYVVGEVTG